MHNLFSFRPGYDEPMKNLARLERNLQRVTLFSNDGVLFFSKILRELTRKKPIRVYMECPQKTKGQKRGKNKRALKTKEETEERRFVSELSPERLY